MPTMSYQMIRWRGTAAFVTVVMLIVSAAQTHAGHVMLQKAGLYEEPTSYTSLAFADPQFLPTQLNKQRVNIDVSFTIGNISAASREYKWLVLLDQGGHVRRAAAGNVSVASRKRVTIIRSTEISCAPRRQVRLIVRLANPAESINASTTCRSQRS
jgi:hypothetical protein